MEAFTTEKATGRDTQKIRVFSTEGIVGRQLALYGVLLNAEMAINMIWFHTQLSTVVVFPTALCGLGLAMAKMINQRLSRIGWRRA